MQFVSGSLWK